MTGFADFSSGDRLLAVFGPGETIGIGFRSDFAMAGGGGGSRVNLPLKANIM
jgi:hypothetical protein